MKLKITVWLLVSIMLSSVTAWAGLTKTEISQLYVSVFNRASEGEGNAYWQSQPDMATAASAMLDTDAARDYFGLSLDTHQAFIEHIYWNTLNKDITDDPDGIAYWVGMLKAGTSRGSVVASLVGVIKDYAPGGPYYDPDNAVTIAAYWQFVNRVTVSDYMADTVYNTPEDWATSTAFSSDLNVTDDPETVITAKIIVDDFNVVRDAIIICNTRNSQQNLDVFIALLESHPESVVSVYMLGSEYNIPLQPDSSYSGGVTVDPDSVNGTEITFAVDDRVFSGRIPDRNIDGYNGVLEMPETTYLGKIGGTNENPVIAWENPWNDLVPPGVLLTQYRLRIYESGGSSILLDQTIRTGLESTYQTFDFGTIGFEFDLSKKYEIRIEARKHIDLLDINDPDNLLDSGSWVGVINRNVVQNDYDPSSELN